MRASSGSLTAPISEPLAQEHVEVLLRSSATRVERIVSRGHHSPDAFWFEQPDDELVVLIAGRAGLDIENETETRTLEPGDWLLLPAGLRHRVAWTASGEDTVWLAVFVQGAPG